MRGRKLEAAAKAGVVVLKVLVRLEMRDRARNSNRGWSQGH